MARKVSKFFKTTSLYIANLGFSRPLNYCLSEMEIKRHLMRDTLKCRQVKIFNHCLFYFKIITQRFCFKGMHEGLIYPHLAVHMIPA